MKCHIRPIRFDIRFEFKSLLSIRFVFDLNANGRFAGPYYWGQSDKMCSRIDMQTHASLLFPNPMTLRVDHVSLIAT